MSILLHETHLIIDMSIAAYGGHTLEEPAAIMKSNTRLYVFCYCLLHLYSIHIK